MAQARYIKSTDELSKEHTKKEVRLWYRKLLKELY